MTGLDTLIDARIEAALKDPTRYPQELKAWLPRYLEVNPPATQLVDIQGLYTMAATVNDLGAKINGRIGMLRTGSTPFDYLRITYDETRGKWISDPVPIVNNMATAGTPAAMFSTTSTSYVEITSATVGTLPWSPLDTAGVKPEVRLIARLGNATANKQSTIAINVHSASSSAIVGQAYAVETTYTPPGANGTNFIDTGWVDGTAGITVQSFILFNIDLKTETGGTALVDWQTGILRWVSK